MTAYRPHPRAQAILAAYVEAWPNATEQEIADQFGVRYQRVGYVLKRAGVPVGHTVQRTRAMMRGITYCRCGQRKSADARTCPRCRVGAPRVTLPCNWCGTPVTRAVSDVENNRRHTHKTETVLYCNRHCQGHWLAAHHGFGARSRNGAVAGELEITTLLDSQTPLPMAIETM